MTGLRRFFRWLTLVTLLLSGAQAHADGPLFAGTEIKRLASDGSGGDEFGAAAAIGGDTLVVGAPLEDSAGGQAGAAYVFLADQGGTGNWGQVRKLVPSDAENADEFGTSVAIDGDILVVGMPLDDGHNDTASDAGAAYIYYRNQGGSNNWGQVVKIVSSSAGDQLGSAVAVSGDLVAIGAPFNDTEGPNAGAVYLFSRNQGGADKWGLAKVVVAGDASATDEFGTALDLDGETLLVGVPEETTIGSVYFFERDQGGANQWGQVRKRIPSEASSGAEFGRSVALHGDRAVVGAPGDSSDDGSAFLFERDTGGANNWGEFKKLVPAEAANNARFGTDVGIAGIRVCVGAPIDDSGASNAGAMYLYHRDGGGYGQWGQSERVLASDFQFNDAFGQAVAMVQNTVVAGAYHEDEEGSNAGSAYLYPLTFNQPPEISDQSFSVEENAPEDTYVGTVTASDPNNGQNIGFQIIEDPSGGAFELDPVSGDLTVLDPAKLDHETTPSIVLTVRVNDNGDPILADTASVTVLVQDVPEDVDLVLTKTGPATAIAGQPIAYSITVSNAGPTEATGVIVTDLLPAGVTPSEVQEFDLGTLAVNAATSFPVMVTINGNFSGTLINAAGVTSSIPDSVTDNNQDLVQTLVTRETDLSVTQIAPTDAVAGEEMTYTIVVQNAGPSTADEVTVTDFLPPGVAPGGTVVTNLGTIAAGGQASFDLPVTLLPSAQGPLTNRVQVVAGTTDPDASDNTSLHVTAVERVADLVVTKTAPATIAQGELLTYTISVENLGPSDAPSVTLQDILPPGVAPSGGIVTNIGAVQAGTTASFNLDVTVIFPSGTLSNAVTGIGNGSEDPNTANNRGVAVTTITGSTDLALTKTGPDVLRDQPGLSYTLTVTNRSTITALDVQVVDTLPEGVDFDPAGSDPGCAINGSEVTCDLGTLAGGSSTTVTVAVVVHTNTVGSLTNLASVTTTSIDSIPDNNTDTAVTQVPDTNGNGVPDFVDPDDDGDGMPDTWELQYGLNPTNAADAATSADTDTATNLEEYTADTNPTDPTSFLSLLSVDGAPATLTFTSSSERLYTVEYTDDPSATDWGPLPGLTLFQGVDGLDSRTDPFPGTRRHYRIQVQTPE